ncbi:MAG: AAA family ATPase [Candidatus Omnitrophota bacterium]
MKKISIANQKGGCGKTTTAINLSSALAASGKKILLIDLDPQAHASFGLGVNTKSADRYIYNVLTDLTEKQHPIDECISNVCQNLDIVPSNILLSTLEQELKDKEDAVSRLHQILTASGLNYDYVVMDCPPSLGFLTFNALRASDLVIVPIDMSAFSLMGVGKLLGMLELINIKINHAPTVNALATIFDRRTKYSQTMLDEIKSFFKHQMLETVIRMNVALKKAVAQGISVIQFDKDSNGAQDYMALAGEILKADEETVKSENTDPAETEAAVSVGQQLDNVMTAASQAIAKNIEQAFREVQFKINAPNAKDIYIVGDFNHWKICEENKLSRIEDGSWQKKFELSPGRYKYKFVIDGEWTLDSANQERIQNAYGTFDSVLSL